jgi:transcription elongation GreA/GreB family factor
VVKTEDEEGKASTWFLAPDGGGLKLSGGVQVLTPASPLGAALSGKRDGDEVEVTIQGKRKQWSVTSVE